MVRGITVLNIESFSDKEDMLRNLDINLLFANRKHLKAKQDGKYLRFYKKGKSFGYVTDDFPLYELDLETVDDETNTLLFKTFSEKFEETPYDIKLTVTKDEICYAVLPLNIDLREGMELSTRNIKCCRVQKIYGMDGITPITDLADLENRTIYKGIPIVLLFKNIEDAIKVCKNMPGERYKNIEEFKEINEELIKYAYYIQFTYADGSEVSFNEISKDYKSKKKTKTQTITFDTDHEYSITYTIPTAINTFTNDVLSKITECRADSVDKNGINISVNNEKIVIKQEKVRVGYQIEKIN